MGRGKQVKHTIRPLVRRQAHHGNGVVHTQGVGSGGDDSIDGALELGSPELADHGVIPDLFGIAQFACYSGFVLGGCQGGEAHCGEERCELHLVGWIWWASERWVVGEMAVIRVLGKVKNVPGERNRGINREGPVGLI